MIIGTAFLLAITFASASFARRNIIRMAALVVLGGSLILIILWAGGLMNVWILKFQTLLNLGVDQSLQVRIRTTQIFYTLFLNSPLFGYGPGSIGLFESLYRIWSTDVGFPAALAGYGLITNATVVVLLIAVIGKLRLILTRSFDDEGRVYGYGLLAFVIVALVSYMFTQNYFFIPPWNYSLATA